MDDVLQGQISEAQKAFAEALKPVVQEIARIIREIIAATKPIIDAIIERAKVLVEYVLELYPNKRVIFLATHGHGRTQKKNINRILKWLRKEGVF